jgi:hypothetical protein
MFSMHGLSTFITTLDNLAPHPLKSGYRDFHAVKSMLLQSHPHDKPSDVDKLRRLLQAIIDPTHYQSVPNDHGEPRPWQIFMEKLGRNYFIILPNWQGLLEVEKGWTPTDPSDTSVIATRDEAYACSFVQNVVQTFIEFGGELKPEDVGVLITHLVKPRTWLRWQEFLSKYSKPEDRMKAYQW